LFKWIGANIANVDNAVGVTSLANILQCIYKTLTRIAAADNTVAVFLKDSDRLFLDWIIFKFPKQFYLRVQLESEKCRRIEAIETRFADFCQYFFVS
jgi:hypothetical protein